MAHTSAFFTSNRSRFITGLVLAAVAGILLLGIHTSGARAENHCGTSEVCIWTGASYGGTEGRLACYVGTIPIGFPEQYSAKNRCSISQELGWNEGGSINWKICMNPGGERPEPGRLNVYRVHSGSC